MCDYYKEMYIKLFEETTKVISLLQQAQINTEQIFMEDMHKKSKPVLHLENKEQNK